MRRSRSFTLALATILVALVLPSAAFGQATRTWVSGVGDDVNPCSRTAPCRTLPGAISKTAAGGEINALDGGGFGAVTIGKSITIDFSGSWHGGVLTNVSNGIVVNAAATDRVVLRGLDINGLNSSFHGIRILQARSVKIVNSNIFNWGRNGIFVDNANALTRVVVKRSDIHDNAGNGVLVAPQGTNAARVTLRGNDIDDNGCGISAARGFDPAFNYAVNCGTVGTNGSTPVINAFRNSISDSEKQGVLANGANAVVRLSQNEITGSNTAPAMEAFNAGSILTFNNNLVVGNPGGNGATTGSAGGLS